jgi:hypothetical protein
MATCVRDMLNNFSLDFIGLQEKIKKDYDQHVFQKLDPGNSYSWK